MKHVQLRLALIAMLGFSNLAQAAYPIETYPEDIREQGYPNTRTIPKPVAPLTQAEEERVAIMQKPTPAVKTESKRLFPLLICEPNIAKEDKHLVKSCHLDHDKIYLTTQQGVELITAKDSSKKNLYLGKVNKAHEIKNVLSNVHLTNDKIIITLITIKNKRYTMELATKSTNQ